MLMLGRDDLSPAYHPPPLFTGNRTLDKVLAVWYRACDQDGPPSWEAMGALIWEPWFVHLVVVESAHRMKPGRCLAVFPVAAALLGVPMFGFRGILPVDNPRAAALSALTRVVSMRRRMVFRRLPERGEGTAGGIAGRPLAAGMPLASTGRVERVLFAVVNAGG